MKHLLIIQWILFFSVLGQIGYSQSSNSKITPKGSTLPQTRFEHLTIENGLSGNVIYNMLEDRKGYMWFNTLNGLDRYDGYKFTSYQYRPHDTTSIAQNILFALYEDSQENLWMGSTEGGICKFDRKTEKFTTYRPKQPKGFYVPAFRSVSAICEDSEGMIWAGSYGGELRRFDKKTGKFLQQFDLSKEAKRSVGRYAINCIVKDHLGRLWIGSSLGLHRVHFTPGKDGKLSGIRFTHYLPNPANPNSISGDGQSIFEDHLGYLWIGTGGKGLNRFDPKTSQFVHYVNNPNDPFSISNNAIFHQNITEDRLGNLWVGTLGGLNKLNPERTQFTRYINDPLQPFSLGDNRILSLAFDRAGTLWVGTAAGVSKLVATPKPFNLYAHNPYQTRSVSAGSVSAIYEDKSGDLWIGANSLSKLTKQTGAFTHYTPPVLSQSSFNPGVNELLKDHLGTFWVAAGNQLVRFNPQTGRFSPSGFKQLDEELKKQQAILSLYEDRDGLLWIGSHLDVYTVDPNTRLVKHYAHQPTNPNGIADYLVNVIRGDRRGNIWMGHGSGAGLTRFNKRTGKFTWFSYNPHDTTSVSANTVQSLYEDPQGYLWIGTVGGGLCKFDHNTEKFSTYAAKQGLSAGTVYSILPDGKNNLWLGTDDGLFCFSLTTHTVKRYDSSDGLQSNLFSKAAWQGADGTLYMGGPGGFNAFDPTQIKANPYVPPIVITEFRIFDKPVSGKKEAKTIELNYDQNFFSFEFAALNFINSHKNQYAYQLVGVDKEWVYSGTRRNVSYTDLQPGDYTFRVKASNNDGVWNEKGISVQVIIYPPWWKTWWAYTLIADDLTQNLQKITHHGGRASAIVKGMLEHSRTSTGEKRPTDLNALAEEYLKIAYQGWRSKNKTFTCELVTDFNPALGLVEVAPQEVGRVLLNLFKNAFYAVSQRAEQAETGYKPTVSVITKQLDNQVTVSVGDNGTGIPDAVKAKIFQPFFTTKPTGEGTGLGLSLSYDIVTKGHGGTLTVESKERESTKFVISLPA